MLNKDEKIKEGPIGHQTQHVQNTHTHTHTHQQRGRKKQRKQISQSGIRLK